MDAMLLPNISEYLGKLDVSSSPPTGRKILVGCGLVAFRVADRVRGGFLGTRADVIQQKAGRTVQFEVTEQTRQALATWIAKRQLSKQDSLFAQAWQGRAPVTVQRHSLIDLRATRSGSSRHSGHSKFGKRWQRKSKCVQAELPLKLATHTVRVVRAIRG